MHIRSFRPYIPKDNETATELICPPFDDESKTNARSYFETHPRCLLSSINPSAIYPNFISPAQLHKKAFDAFRKADNLLIRSTSPCLYVYEQKTNHHIQRGIVALASVKEYENNTIKKHEQTRIVKEKAYTELTNRLSACIGPVLMLYNDVEDIDQIVLRTVKKPSLFHVNIEHTMHQIYPMSTEDSQTIVQLFKYNVPHSYIADGHHRAASAARVARDRTFKANKFDIHHSWFLSVFFPASQLRIISYNRLVRNMNGLSTNHFLKKLSKLANIHQLNRTPTESPTKSGTIFMYINSRWYAVVFHRKHHQSKQKLTESLDASMLQRHVFDNILGIEDPKTSQRIEFVSGNRGVKYLADQIDRGNSVIGFALCAVSVQELINIADNNEIMPPKSTWFDPKLCSGFFVHKFDEE